MKFISRLFKPPTPEEEIVKFCQKHKITQYHINDDLTIDVNDSVFLRGLGFEKLPIKFNKVNGVFSCGDNKLITLEGCPKVVDRFSCVGNNLTSLEHAPLSVERFGCTMNKLYSLSGCPQADVIIYDYNPVSSLVKTIQEDLGITINDVIYRMDEFDIIKQNKYDIISLNSLYDFYNIEFSEGNIKNKIKKNIDEFQRVNIQQL